MQRGKTRKALKRLEAAGGVGAHSPAWNWWSKAGATAILERVRELESAEVSGDE